MTSKKSFRVAVIANLTDRETQMLTTAARLTTGRLRSYVFEPNPGPKPEIYLVDADCAETRERWRALQARHPAPAVFLKPEDHPASGRNEFQRPILPARLLNLINLLDQVTVQDLHFLPELSIGNGAAPDVAEMAVGLTARQPWSILVVDDSPTVRAQVGLGLKLFGAAASFAETGEQALELVAKHSYDIAFLDVILPGADGYQICKAIKKDPRHKKTKVVMLTSKTSPFDRVKASLAGCDSYLTKPVENTIFQETLKKYLVVPGNQGVMGATGHPAPAT